MNTCTHYSNPICKRSFFACTIPLLFLSAAMAQQSTVYSEKVIEKKLDSILRRMTLEEKAGQLTQYTGDRLTATGPLGKPIDKIEEIKAGRVGSLLNVRGALQTKKM